MNYEEVQKIVLENKRIRDLKIHQDIVNIIGNYTVIRNYSPLIVNNESSKKHIIVFSDNEGVKCMIQQINIFKQYTYQLNGSPGKNTKIIYNRNDDLINTLKQTT